MRVLNVEQGSEDWDVFRMTRPTASEFNRIITPAKGELSSGKAMKSYACELVARQIGAHTEGPPDFWMQWGIDNEPEAVHSYCALNQASVEHVGFVIPDDHERYGGSPDGFVNDREGLLETKCPKPETLIRYHWEGKFPVEYRPQVQGLLLITGLAWCDFFAWHPAVQPFQVRVEPDEEYQETMREALDTFCDIFEDLKSKVSGVQKIRWGE